MKPSLRLLCSVLLTAFALSGCAEQILDSASKDPAPSVTSGEAGFKAVVAEFDIDKGRFPQPSDLVLNTVNESLIEGGGETINGVSRLMPIRIPFDEEIVNLYDNDTWSESAGQKLKENLLIFPTTNLTTGSIELVDPRPTIGGGAFKVVYQDENKDLVLVPDNNTFQSGTQYVVAVKSSLGDVKGNKLSPEILTSIITYKNPIVVDGQIRFALTDNLTTAKDLESLRQLHAPLALGLENYGYIESNNDLAVLFTFTTETESTSSTALFEDVEANISSLAKASGDNITWVSNANLLGSSALPSDQPENILSLVLASQNPAPPSDQVSALYKGYFSCQNFLDNTSGEWELKLETRAENPVADCPNSDPALNGKIGFWIAKPSAVSGVVIFQHGLTYYKETMFAIMNTLAGYGFATVAIDAWGHGDRTYEDVDQNGDFSNDSGLRWLRPDNPALTAGYFLQTQFDLIYFRTLLEANSEISTAIGNTPGSTPIHYVGQSLGAIIGSNLASAGFLAERFVLNVPGGDLSDFAASQHSSIGQSVRAGVLVEFGIDNTTEAGKSALESTMLGIELSGTHAFYKALTDPLAGASKVTPNEVLLQQIIGDEVIPNTNTELLSLAMGLTTYNDGNGFVTGVSRSRWILDPSNYQGGTAGHGFLLDGVTTATGQGQLQTACFLLTGNVLDPSKTINLDCTN